MDRQEPLDRLNLQNNPILDHYIHPVAAVEANRFIHHGQRNLSSKCNSLRAKFVADAFLIRGLEKTRSEVTMHLDGEANNLLGQQIIFIGYCHLADLSLPHCLIVNKN